MRALAVLVLALLAASPAAGSDARAQELLQRCHAAADLVALDEPLPRLARRLGERPLVVAVVGSGSSAGGGVSEPARAYPNALQRELEQRLGVPVMLERYAKRGATALEMAEVLRREVAPRRPALAIWQTGTVDAVRGLDINAFGEALDRGVAALHERDIDVVLVDMQFGPQTDALIQLRPYRNYMLWAARRNDVPLFRRHEIMQQWSERDIVDLAATTRTEQLKAADFVHECIGRLLGAAIHEAARAAAPR
ncbi:MAG: hypothetical protein MUC64_14400 [Rubritepida sp.]|jgi:hypothetical protein|nr:hypothetical protein [Rubritepida sp.]